MAEEITRATRLTNAILSGNPCPTCIDADGQTMTMAQWRNSRYGIPGSNKRICNGYCHCILVTAQMLEEFPEIDLRIKLRGDKVTDIRPIIDIYPNELILKDLMDRYNLEIGRLPNEFYNLSVADSIPYLRGLLD